MESHSARELVEQLNKQRVEVSKLRDILNNLDKEKESWFRKKQEASVNIREAIKKIKASKAKRDSLTREVKELKPKRDLINKEIVSKSSELEKLRKEKSKLNSPGIGNSPSKIKHQMERLEFRIETETPSFEQEKELMKKIKELKKLYDASSDALDVNKKWRESSDVMIRMRKEANGLHKTIQEKASQSQLLHEEIIKISGEIDRMNVNEQDAFGKFSDFKQRFNKINAQLKEKLNQMNDVQSQLDKIHYNKREKRKHEQELFLKSKEDAVNEKIKRGEKLTTEDLLVFQKVDR